MPAPGGLHQITYVEVAVTRFHDLAYRTCAHDLTQTYRGQVAGAIDHPVALGGVKREIQITNEHFLIPRGGHGGFGVFKVIGANHAVGAFGQKPLSVYGHRSLRGFSKKEMGKVFAPSR